LPLHFNGIYAELLKKPVLKKKKEGEEGMGWKEGMNVNINNIGRMPALGRWHIPRISRRSNCTYVFLPLYTHNGVH